MIDPQNIVRYDYTDKELEELLIFCICVAGKKASAIAPRVHTLCNCSGWKRKPYLKQMYLMGDQLPIVMRRIGIGCYTAKAETIINAYNANLNLRTCTVADLEKIKGIGAKTARFFVMSSRKNVKHAAIDTHILKWLRGQDVECPKSSPPAGKTYNRLEQEFLSRVPEDMTPAEFDLEIWKKYSNAKRTSVSTS